MEANFSLPSRPARVAVSGRSLLVLVVATLLVPLASRLSSTGPAIAPAAKQVPYAYRDVTSAARVPALYQRFELEALELCESAALVGGLDARSSADCVQRVVDRAVREINAPALTEYHETRQAATEPARVASAR